MSAHDTNERKDEEIMTAAELEDLRAALDAALAESRQALDALCKAQMVTQEDLRTEFSV